MERKGAQSEADEGRHTIKDFGTHIYCCTVSSGLFNAYGLEGRSVCCSSVAVSCVLGPQLRVL